MGTDTEDLCGLLSASLGHRALVVPVEGPVREVVLPVEGAAQAAALREHTRSTEDAERTAHQDVFTGAGRTTLALWQATASDDLEQENPRITMMLRRPGVDEVVVGDVLITSVRNDARGEHVTSLPAAAVEALKARWSS